MNTDKVPEINLRDYFAAKALQGLMGRDWSHMRGCDDAILKAWVTSAYAIADLMIVERNKNEH